MKSKLSIQRFSEGRAKVDIEIELNADETSTLEEKSCARHCESPSAVPCQFYQTPNPKINVVQGLPVFNGKPVKAYVFAKARRVPMLRADPGKTLLRISFPGTLELGYVHERDLPKLENWWEETRTYLGVALKTLLYEVATDTGPVIQATQKTESVKEETLNPFDADEVNGVRRRAFADY